LPPLLYLYIVNVVLIDLRYCIYHFLKPSQNLLQKYNTLTIDRMWMKI